MTIRLLTISRDEDQPHFKASIHLGTRTYIFTFVVNTYPIGNDNINVIQGEPEFYDVLYQHQSAITIIKKLVGRVYAGESVDLPLDI